MFYKIWLPPPNSRANRVRPVPMTAISENPGGQPGKVRAIATMIVAQISVLSLWFVSAAILPEMAAEGGFSETHGAALSSAVQIGFVIGALIIAITGLADRLDPRAVFLCSALIAALANLGLLVTPLGGWEQVALRGLTGACIAGVYPVGMKICVGWGTRDRAFLVGLLVGALTVGSASPHMIALLGGADWRLTVSGASLLAAVGGLLVLGTGLGPHHARAGKFDPGAVVLAWTNRRARLAIAGYLGHMWELYAFWAWVGVAAAASFAGQAEDAGTLARIVAFLAIALGGLVCAPAGVFADRVGRARVAQVTMMASGTLAVLTALSFGGPVWLTAVLLVLWGIAVIPDSALFSALVADAVPSDRAGSVLTFQNALGFTLSAFTVQGVPALAALAGWPVTLALMGLGPLFGIEAMRRLIALRADPAS